MKRVCLQFRPILLLLAILFLSGIAKAQHCKIAIQAIPNFCDPQITCITLSAVPYGTPQNPPYIFLWSTNETTQNICVPNVPATISVTVTDNIGCVVIANFYISAPISSYAWLNQLCYYCCPGDMMDLGVVWAFNIPPDFTYLWSNGEITPGILTNIPGTYSVTLTDPSTGCTLVLSDILAYPPAPDPVIIGPNTLCSGQTVTLSVTGGPYTGIQWLPSGEYTPTIEVSQPGTYVVVVSQNGFVCAGIDTLEIGSGSGNIPPPQLSGPSQLCPDQSGTINIVNEGDYSDFVWNTGETTSGIDISDPGTYTVTVTDAGGCTSSGSITIDPGSTNMNITGTATPLTSCTNPNGSVNISVTPSGSYLYTWSNGSSNEDISDLPSGSYTVTVTDTGGCTSSSSFTVPSNVIFPTMNTNITSSTCDLNNGAVDLSVTPTGTYAFLWSNSQTTEDLSGIIAGTYSVTVTSVSNGCTAVASVNVPNNNIIINVNGNASPNTSCTSPNGTIDITISPAGTFSYSWSNGSTAEDLANLPSGDYTVTVSAGGSCTASATYSVVNNTSSPVPIATSTAATCGQNNGDIDLNSTPVGTYTYLWSNGSTTEDLNAISGGTYSVTVSSANGCTGTTSTLVADNSITLAISGISSPATSCLNQNGAIDITVNPSGMYIYGWSNGATTEDLNNVQAGVYTVTVTFGLTCVNTQSFEVLNAITPIGFTGSTSPNTSCSQPNGAIDITMDTPGTFNYAWSNGATTEDLQSLTGGTYSVTVTGNNGCTSTAVFDVINTNSNFSFTGSVFPNTSCLSPNGSIDLTPTPAGTYTFIWSNGASTEDLQNLFSGNYNVTVADINNCSSVSTFILVDALSFPVISTQISPSTCGGSNGSIDISVLPVTGNTFSWSNGSTLEDQSNLPTANYIVTVTGVNGCIAIDTITVDNQNSNFTLAAVAMPDQSCINPNGSIDLSVAPSGTYSFTWSDGTTTEDIQNKAGGTYSVSVTDPLGCTTSDTFIITSNISFPALSANITAANCGANNGVIDLTITPTGNNTFLWSGGEITEDLQNIFPGSYSVIVTDTNGCQTLDTFSVLNINTNFSLSAASIPTTSCVNSNGAIDLTVSPTGTYTFIWSNGGMAEDLTNLSAGSYTVTVTDNMSCASAAIFVVGSNTSLVTISTFISPSLCGAGNGTIDLSVNPTSGNTFLWSNGALSEDVQNLIAGSYSVTVTGMNGCLTIDTFTVPDLGSVISLSGIPAANTNCVSPNGSIDLTVSPAGTYTFTWSNGNGSEDQTNLSPGSYDVTVTDLNGCSSTATYIIDNLTIDPVITASITPSTCGKNNGSIDISIIPSGLYMYTWSNGQVSEDIQDVFSGPFSLTVTGANGCSASLALVIPNTNSNFSISASTSDNTSCTNSNGAINLTVVPSGSYNFLWSNGTTTEDLQNLPAGIYTVTVTDISSCSTTGTYILDHNVVDLLVEETITPVLCGEPNGHIDLNVTPPIGNSFIWSTGSTTEDLDNILPGFYSVTVTGQNGCKWSSGFSVPGSVKIELVIEASAINTGDSSVTISALVNLPLSALDTLIWLPENLFICTQPVCMEQTINRPSQQTEIIVMAVDTNGCIAEARLLLENETNTQVYIPNVFTPDRDGVNDFFTIYGNKNVEMIIELRIFDRWGNFVFINNQFPPNEENYGWDGRFRNLEMNPAVYAYWARVRFADGSEKFYKGDVTLVR